MLLASVSMLFALFFGSIVVQCGRHGWRFLRLGWQAIQAFGPRASGPGMDVEARRAVAEGGQFVIGGLLWLGLATLAALATAFCLSQVVIHLGLLAPI